MPNWKPQKKLSNFVKWGFKIDPNDKDQIIPIPEQEALMDKAFEYIKTGEFSYRDIANWLIAHSGRKISHVALVNHWKKHLKKIRSDRWRAGRAKTQSQIALSNASKAETQTSAVEQIAKEA